MIKKLILILMIVLVSLSCKSKDKKATPHDYRISWDANLEPAVNTTGGGYKVYYSKDPGLSTGVYEFDVPYVSGASAPTSANITITTGNWYVSVKAYANVAELGGEIFGTSSVVTQIQVP